MVSPNDTLTVTLIATTTVVTPSSDTISAGQSAMFTATVSSSNGTPPDGSIQFLVNGSNYGSPVALSGSTATELIAEPKGTYTIAAKYTGDANYAATLPAGETTGTLIVNPAGLVSIAVAPAGPSIALGLTESFTATGTYTDNSTQNLTSQVTWLSSNIAVATINASGLATTLSTGTTEITATLGSNVSPDDTLTVTPAALVSIDVTPSSPSISKGLTQQFTATGTYTNTSTQDLTSQVTWASATPTVASISASGLATALTGGTTAITASMGGVTSPKDTLTVFQAATTTVVTPGSATVPYGQSPTFTATVSSPTGMPTDGTVQFLVNGSNYGNPVAVGVGTAQLAIAEPAGTFAISAQYNGDASYAATLPAAETAATLTVGPAATTTSVSPGSASVPSGQSATFTAIVTSSSAPRPPDGSVQFLVNGTDYGSPVTVAGGTAQLAITEPLGTYAVTAQYAGDGTNYAASAVSTSSSLIVTQSISKVATSTVVTPTPISVNYGQSATFTATVSSSSGTPTDGFFQFLVNGANYGNPVPLVSGGTAQELITEPAGSYTITARYGGDTTYAATLQAAQTPASFTVVQASTTISLSPGSASVISPQTATFTANVGSPSGAPPDGTVQFLVNGATYGTATVSGGTAQLPISEPAGTYTVTAQYLGDVGNYAQSAVSTGSSLTVTTPSLLFTTTTLTPSLPVVGAGQPPATFTANVNSTSGAPTDGSVQFLVNGSDFGAAVPLSGGSAQLAINEPPGTYTIRAQYLGDQTQYAASPLSADATLTVLPGAAPRAPRRPRPCPPSKPRPCSTDCRASPPGPADSAPIGILAQELPIVDESIGSALNLTNILEVGLVNPLQAASIATIGDVVNILQNLKASAPGLTITVNPADVTGGLQATPLGQQTIVFSLDFDATQTTTTGFDPGANASQYGLSTSVTGGVTLSATFDLDFTFGINLTAGLSASDAFFINVQDLSAGASASFNNPSFAAQVGFLGVQVQNGAIALNAGLKGTVIDPNQPATNDVTLTALKSDAISDLVTLTPSSQSLNVSLPVQATLGTWTASGSPAITLGSSTLFSGAAPTVAFNADAQALLAFDRLTPSDFTAVFNQLGTGLNDIAPNLDVPGLATLPFLGKQTSQLVDFTQLISNFTNALYTPGIVGAPTVPQDGQLSDDAVFSVAINGQSPVNVTVTKAATKNDQSIASLVGAINAALATTSLKTKIQAILDGSQIELIAIDASVTQFQIQLANPATNTAATELGFAPGQTSTSVFKFTTIQTLAPLLTAIMGVPASPQYNPTTQSLSFVLDFQDGEFTQTLPLSLGSWQTVLQGTGPAPANGQLAADASFTLTIGSQNPVTVTITAASTSNNHDLGDLVAEINHVLAAENVTSVVAGSSNGAITLTDINGDSLQAGSLGSNPFSLPTSMTTATDSSLGPLTFEGSATATVTATPTIDATLGINLGGLATVLTGTSAPPSNGVLTADAHFSLTIGNQTPIVVTVTAASTQNDQSPSDLVKVINSALASAGVTGAVVAGLSNGGLITLTDNDGDVLQIGGLATDPATTQLHLPTQAPVTLARVLSATAAAPSNGVLTADAHFSLTVGNQNPVNVRVTAAATQADQSPSDLVTQINNALAAAGVGSEVVAGLNGNIITLTDGAGDMLQVTAEASDPATTQLNLPTQRRPYWPRCSRRPRRRRAMACSPPMLTSRCRSAIRARSTSRSRRPRPRTTRVPLDLVGDLNSALAAAGVGGKVVAGLDGTFLTLTDSNGDLLQVGGLATDPATTELHLPTQSKGVVQDFSDNVSLASGGTLTMSTTVTAASISGSGAVGILGVSVQGGSLSMSAATGLTLNGTAGMSLKALLNDTTSQLTVQPVTATLQGQLPITVTGLPSGLIPSLPGSMALSLSLGVPNDLSTVLATPNAAFVSGLGGFANFTAADAAQVLQDVASLLQGTNPGATLGALSAALPFFDSSTQSLIEILGTATELQNAATVLGAAGSLTSLNAALQSVLGTVMIGTSPVPTDGVLSGPANFSLTVGGNSPVNVTVPVHASNTSVDDLVSDINAAIAAASPALAGVVIAGHDAEGDITLTDSYGVLLQVGASSSDPTVTDLHLPPEAGSFRSAITGLPASLTTTQLINLAQDLSAASAGSTTPVQLANAIIATAGALSDEIAFLQQHGIDTTVVFGTGNAPSDGQLTADAHFSVKIGNQSPVAVTISAASTQGDLSPTDLVNVINNALTTAGIGTSIVAGLDGNLLTLTDDNGDAFQVTATSTDPAVAQLNLPAQGAAATVLTGTAAGPSNGRITADAHFTLTVGNQAPVNVTVAAASTGGNANLGQLVGDINTALQTAGVGSNVSAQVNNGIITLVNSKGDLLAITAMPGDTAVTELELPTLQPLQTVLTELKNATPSLASLSSQIDTALKIASPNSLSIQFVTSTAPGNVGDELLQLKLSLQPSITNMPVHLDSAVALGNGLGSLTLASGNMVNLTIGGKAELDFGYDLPSQVAFLLGSTNFALTAQIAAPSLNLTGNIGAVAITSNPASITLANGNNTGPAQVNITMFGGSNTEFPFAQLVTSNFQTAQINGLLKANLPITISGSSAGTVSVTYNLQNQTLTVPPDATLNASLNGAPFDYSQLFSGLQAFIKMLSSGISAQLEKLPLIGHDLDLNSPNGIITELQTDFLNPLKTALNANPPDPSVAINSAISFLSSKIPGLVLPSSVATYDAPSGIVMIPLDLTGKDTYTTSFNSNLAGLGLGIKTTGGITLNLGYTLDLGFELSKSGGFSFILKPDAMGNEFELTVSAALTPGAQLQAKLFILNVMATNSSADPIANPSAATDLTASLGLNLQAPGGGNQLTVAQLATAVFGADYTAKADAYVNLHLEADIDPNLPNIQADLQITYPIIAGDNADSAGTEPTVALANVTLNIGTFLQKIIDPILNEIDTVLAPVKPLLDFLNSPVPVLSSFTSLLGQPPLTWAGLASAFGYGSSTLTTAISVLDELADLADEAQSLAADGTLINFGTFTFGTSTDLRNPDSVSGNANPTSLGSERRRRPEEARMTRSTTIITPSATPSARASSSRTWRTTTSD